MKATYKHTDEDLLTSLNEGSEDAFSILYARYWEQVYLSALKRVQSEDVAKDITQELFISLWNKKGTLEIRNNLSVYLKQAVKFKVIDYFREKINHPQYKDHAQSLINSHSPIEDKIDVNHMELLLKNALDKMPSRMRLIFQMSRNDNKSILEIGNELGLSSQTVKNQITNAIGRLKKAFNIFIFICLIINQ